MSLSDISWTHCELIMKSYDSENTQSQRYQTENSAFLIILSFKLYKLFQSEKFCLEESLEKSCSNISAGWLRPRALQS